jgi:ABC-type uncharacterized transport system permease subunit
MAEKLETHTRWENADQRLHEEKELPAIEAKQGRKGYRVLAVLIVALILAAIVWVLTDFWGRETTPATAPQGQITTTAPSQ